MIVTLLGLLWVVLLVDLMADCWAFWKGVHSVVMWVDEKVVCWVDWMDVLKGEGKEINEVIKGVKKRTT